MPAALRTWVVPVLAGAARVALGGLWLNEGITKYRAGFGSADSPGGAAGAAPNTRVPDYFAAFAEHVLGPQAELFGFLMPLLETALVLGLIAGVLTLPAAVNSTLALLSYWSADQLIDQYPVMLGLSVLVVAVPAQAGRFSVTSLALRVVPSLRRRTDASWRRWL